MIAEGLHVACSKGHSKQVARLLENEGTNIEGVNGKGDSPLFVACLAGNTKCAELLLEKGSNAITEVVNLV